MSVLELDELYRATGKYIIIENCSGITEIRIPNFNYYESGNGSGGFLRGLSKLKFLFLGNNVELIRSTNLDTFYNVGFVEFIDNGIKRMEVGNRVSFSYCYNLTTLALNELESYGWGFANATATLYDNCAKLTTVLLPKLTTFLGAIDSISIIGQQPGIRKLVLGKVGNMTSAANLCRYGTAPTYYLIHLEIGDGTEKSVNFQRWLPSQAFSITSSDLVEDSSICSNNLEQFLYNFREFIVKKVSVQTSKKYIYLHSTTKSYILGEDDSHYAANWIVHGESDTYLNTLNDELTARNWGLA